MNRPRQRVKPSIGLYTKVWLFSLVGAFVLSFLFRWFDNFTELAPDHSGEVPAYVLLALVVGVINAVVGWRLASAGSLNANSVPALAALGFLLIGFLAALLALLGAVDFAHGLIDFPPAKTRSAREVLPIRRAWQTHGKGRSWNIQTRDSGTAIEITEHDYDFMLAHRSLDDHGTDPDEISAQGWFCARVTVERAGDAVRVMLAGDGDLPRGSMILCPRTID